MSTSRTLRSVRRAVAGLLVVNAAIHLYLTPMHLREAPYIGVLFALLSVACLGLAVLVVTARAGAGWVAASGVVSLAGLVAFVVSRTVGLPQIGDDVGNWGEPLGVATMVVEVVTIALAVPALLSLVRLTRSPSSPSSSSGVTR